MHQTGFGALKILVFEGRTWCIDLDVLIPQVHRVFFRTEMHRNAWYIDFGSLQSLGALTCIWGIVSVALV
jgi:hypothetical protein